MLDRRGARPFRFQRLEKVSRADARLADALHWLLPPQGISAAREAIGARLRELFEEDVSLSLEHLHVVGPDRLPRIIREPTFLAVLAPAPHKSRGLLELDLSLAHAAMDRLLGGSGEAVALRPLTDIEEGVVSFILLEVLRSLAPMLDPAFPRTRLEGTASSVAEAVSVLSEEQHVLVAQFRASLGGVGGVVRLFLPGSVISQARPPEDSPARKARRQSDLERGIGRLRGLKTWVRAEIGRAEVSSRDLMGLRTGDVVLADEVSARPDQGPGGTVRLKVGLGRAGRIEAALQLGESGGFQAKITGFLPGEEPLPPGELGGGEPLPEPPEPMEPSNDATRLEIEEQGAGNVSDGQSAELLNDIPLQLAIELGRVPVTAEEVVALRVGQVIDLNKVPGEPVELSVNGRVVARGELVEIEGHLGVRVLSMVG